MRGESLLPGLWARSATLAAPGLRLMLRARLRRGKELDGRLPERQGVETAPRPAGRLLWLHAASVGETVSVLPVLEALANRAPDVTMLLTTGTVTSARLLASRLPELGLERRVLHRFVPLDVPVWVARFLDHWRPDAAGFVESELWPNLLAACRARLIPVMLVNARMSPRSYARWRRAPALAHRVLGSFTRVQAQSETDAERLRDLGARAVTAPGNLKFAAPPLPVDLAELASLRQSLSGRPIWLAASTHPGEDALVVQAHRDLAARHRGLLTIIAPRHPERGARIAAAIGDVPATRRAAGEPPPAEGVWIADTLGELGLLYRLAGIAFVGRSLVPPGGGQNPLEPARLGCAVAAGPFTDNFTSAVQALEACGGLARVHDAASLAAWVDRMLGDPERREAMGLAARGACARYADLPDRTAAVLLDLLSARARPDMA
jgi:3-deoxy-D-manno-octulosonic-acid transferase